MVCSDHGRSYVIDRCSSIRTPYSWKSHRNSKTSAIFRVQAYPDEFDWVENHQLVDRLEGTMEIVLEINKNSIQSGKATTKTVKNKIINWVDGTSLKQALRLVWQSGPYWFCADILLILAHGLVPVASLFLLKHIADMAVILFHQPAQMKPLIMLVLMLGGIHILEMLMSSLTSWVSEVQSQNLSCQVYDLLHTQSLAMDMAYYENSAYQDMYFRAQQEASYRPLMMVKALISTFQSMIMLVALAGVLVSLHWIMGTIFILSVVPGIWMRNRYTRILSEWQNQSAQAERQAHYYHWILTSDSCAKDIRMFQFGSAFKQRFQKILHTVHEGKRKILKKRMGVEISYQAAFIMAVFIAVIWVMRQMAHGLMSVGDVILCYQAVMRCQSAMKAVLSGISGLYEHGMFFKNFLAFMNLKPSITKTDYPVPVPERWTDGIRFEHVSFCYPLSSQKVLEDISLHIKPGEHIAFVGENGSGKTTLVKLLCRLYDPTQGTICLNGINIKAFDPVEFRQKISVIFQDYGKYYLTVRDNIGIGNLEAMDQNERLWNAAHLSGAYEVVERLPNGYDTMLGRLFNKGEELSTGQWQKIALARTLMKDAELIILDEPTSSLDPIAEYDLYHRLKHAMKGKTVIFITHRLSMAKLADRIVVFKHGRIVEYGCHDELIQHGGEYARLFQLHTHIQPKPKHFEVIQPFL